jgi:hypothetical protein
MTLRENIEAWLFGALIVIGLPALIYASQQWAG